MGRYYESKDRGHNAHFSGILAAKNIFNWLDIPPNATHDRPYGKKCSHTIYPLSNESEGKILNN